MITLYTTPALPRHWVGENEHGQRWLVPQLPNAAAAWAQRKPYRGNYILLPVAAPDATWRYMDEAEVKPESARTESLRIRLSPFEKARLQAKADAEGMSVSAYIRHSLEL